MRHINVALFVVHKGCPHMCSFCNQRSISGFNADLTALDVKNAAELALRGLKEDEALGGEIAFFGGSFTMIEPSYMICLLESAYEFIKNGRFKGIRISTRPDGINEEICRILKKYGVTAVELGAQSLDDRVLELNERGHTAQDVINAVKMLKSFGFETGLQMMTGLYGSDDSDSIETAKKIIELKADTVRIYPTVVLKNTRLYELMQAGKFEPKTVEQSVPLCAELIKMFEKAKVKIIRVGLHSGGNVDEGFAGGCYHPAFKELCESRIYLDLALERLKEMPHGDYEVLVNPKEISKMTGQKRSNINALRALGYSCFIRADEGINKYEIEIKGI